MYDLSDGLKNLLGRVATVDQLNAIQVSLNLNGVYRNVGNVFSEKNTFNNDVDINSTLDVKTASGWGNVHCIPAVTGNEAAIGFFKNNNSNVSSSVGDVWLVGSNLFQTNPLCFSIATNT